MIYTYSVGSQFWEFHLEFSAMPQQISQVSQVTACGRSCPGCPSQSAPPCPASCHVLKETCQVFYVFSSRRFDVDDVFPYISSGSMS